MARFHSLLVALIFSTTCLAGCLDSSSEEIDEAIDNIHGAPNPEFVYVERADADIQQAQEDVDAPAAGGGGAS